MTRASIFATLLLSVIAAAATATAQPLRLGAIERRHPDAIALVADAATGRIVGGIRTAESRGVACYPASLFKLAIAVALLESTGAGERYDCDGADTIDRRAWRCWLDAGHGALGLEGALAHSCNLWFRNAARSISRSALATRAQSLGLLPEGYSGSLDADVLLGEAAAVTPAQLMRTALALASRGRLAQPTLPLGSPRYHAVYRGLRECVRSGTARAAWSRRTSIAGKTGTASVAGRPGVHTGWFVGFAPFERPRYAIVVLDRRGFGSEAAAIAREILEAIL